MMETGNFKKKQTAGANIMRDMEHIPCGMSPDETPCLACAHIMRDMQHVPSKMFPVGTPCLASLRNAMPAKSHQNSHIFDGNR